MRSSSRRFRPSRRLRRKRGGRRCSGRTATRSCSEHNGSRRDPEAKAQPAPRPRGSLARTSREHSQLRNQRQDRRPNQGTVQPSDRGGLVFRTHPHDDQTRPVPYNDEDPQWRRPRRRTHSLPPPMHRPAPAARQLASWSRYPPEPPAMDTCVSYLTRPDGRHRSDDSRPISRARPNAAAREVPCVGSWRRPCEAH